MKCSHCQTYISDVDCNKSNRLCSNNLIKLLLNNNIRIQHKNNKGDTILSITILKQNITVLKILLDHIFSNKILDVNFEHALFQAAYVGNCELFNLIYQHPFCTNKSIKIHTLECIGTSFLHRQNCYSDIDEIIVSSLIFWDMSLEARFVFI